MTPPTKPRAAQAAWSAWIDVKPNCADSRPDDFLAGWNAALAAADQACHDGLPPEERNDYISEARIARIRKSIAALKEPPA